MVVKLTIILYGILFGGLSNLNAITFIAFTQISRVSWLTSKRILSKCLVLQVSSSLISPGIPCSHLQTQATCTVQARFQPKSKKFPFSAYLVTVNSTSMASSSSTLGSWDDEIKNALGIPFVCFRRFLDSSLVAVVVNRHQQHENSFPFTASLLQFINFSLISTFSKGKYSLTQITSEPTLGTLGFNQRRR